MWPFDIKRKRREAEERAAAQRQEDVARFHREADEYRRKAGEDLAKAQKRHAESLAFSEKWDKEQSKSRLSRPPAPSPEVRIYPANSSKSSWPYPSSRPSASSSDQRAPDTFLQDQLMHQVLFNAVQQDSSPAPSPTPSHHCSPSPSPSPSYDSSSSSSCDSSSSSSDSGSSGGWD